MLSSVPLLAFLGAILLALYKFFLYPTFISPLSKIPNAHWSAPFSPVWVLWLRYRLQENRTLHKSHLKLGPVIRLAPNELSVNDVVGLRIVYAGGFEKGQWYSIFDNYGSPALAAQAQIILYQRLLPILDRLSTASGGATGVDVHDLWNATTMDGMTAYQFGIKNSSNFLQNDEYRRHWLSLYHARKTYTFFSQELPSLTRFCKTIRVHLVPSWVNDANLELEAWTQGLCDSTMAWLKEGGAESEEIANEPVVLNALLAGIAKEKNTKGETSILAPTLLKHERLSIASEMIDQLAAGHETSGITLTYLTYQLSLDPTLQNLLRTELLTLSPKMLLSSRSIPSSRELDALPLLHAILMETLRLRAAIPGSQPRMTPHPSCTLSGYHVPGGVRVGAQAHSVHRNAEVYPEPEKWDYMRWMDGDNGYSEEQKRERDRWFWAFSSGGRMCVGSNFAMHEIKMVVAAVYSNFRTYVVNDAGIEQMDGYTTGPVSNKLTLRFEKVGA